MEIGSHTADLKSRSDKQLTRLAATVGRCLPREAPDDRGSRTQKSSYETMRTYENNSKDCTDYDRDFPYKRPEQFAYLTRTREGTWRFDDVTGVGCIDTEATVDLGDFR